MERRLSQSQRVVLIGSTSNARRIRRVQSTQPMKDAPWTFDNDKNSYIMAPFSLGEESVPSLGQVFLLIVFSQAYP